MAVMVAVGKRKAREKGEVGGMRYVAAVCGDGRITPITETLGRRLIREIDPLSHDGRALLIGGRVTLFYDDGARVERAAIGTILDRMLETARLKRAEFPEIPQWTAHHDHLLESLTRMKRRLHTRN